jgi:hypothetical protein
VQRGDSARLREELQSGKSHRWPSIGNVDAATGCGASPRLSRMCRVIS